MITKVCVIGNVNVGKTCFIRRYTDGSFTDGYKATVGVDFCIKDGMTFWDIAGQERFGAMTSVFYRGADGALVVMDYNAEGSLDTAFKWINDFIQKMDRPVPIVLVCNKGDLPGRYTLEDIESRCKMEPNVVHWALASAKTGQGVDAAVSLLKGAIEKREKERDETIRLEDEIETKSTCCF